MLTEHHSTGLPRARFCLRSSIANMINTWQGCLLAQRQRLFHTGADMDNWRVGLGIHCVRYFLLAAMATGTEDGYGHTTTPGEHSGHRS